MPTFVKINDDFPDHPKFLEAGPLAGYMALCAIAWSGHNLRDGFIPRAQVPRLCNFAGCFVSDVGYLPDDAVMFEGSNEYTAWDAVHELVRVGLWDEVEGGYMIHDYLEHQSSREYVLKAREKERKRWQERQAAAASGNGSGGDSV